MTVSNATAHLAGALGKETYLIVPSGRGRMWFWFRDRDDSPFYPRMQLKRKQPAAAVGRDRRRSRSGYRAVMLAAQRAHTGSISESEQKAIGQALETGVALHQRG